MGAMKPCPVTPHRAHGALLPRRSGPRPPPTASPITNRASPASNTRCNSQRRPTMPVNPHQGRELERTHALHAAGATAAAHICPAPDDAMRPRIPDTDTNRPQLQTLPAAPRRSERKTALRLKSQIGRSRETKVTPNVTTSPKTDAPRHLLLRRASVNP